MSPDGPEGARRWRVPHVRLPLRQDAVPVFVFRGKIESLRATTADGTIAEVVIEEIFRSAPLLQSFARQPVLVVLPAGASVAAGLSFVFSTTPIRYGESMTVRAV